MSSISLYILILILIFCEGTGMATIEVKEIDITNKKLMKQFIMLPWTTKIYENDPAWVPPIIADQKKVFNPKTG